MFNGGTTKGRVTSIVTIGSLIVIILTIYAFVGGGIDGKIDNKIIAHEKDTEAVQYEMQQDIAIIQVQQKTIVEDIGEIKQQMKDDTKEIKEMIRNQ